MQTHNAAAAVAQCVCRCVVLAAVYAITSTTSNAPACGYAPIPDRPAGAPRPPAAGALVQVQVPVSGDVLASCLCAAAMSYDNQGAPPKKKKGKKVTLSEQVL
jgi:hypothetical protein